MCYIVCKGEVIDLSSINRKPLLSVCCGMVAINDNTVKIKELHISWSSLTRRFIPSSSGFTTIFHTNTSTILRMTLLDFCWESIFRSLFGHQIENSFSPLALRTSKTLPTLIASIRPDTSTFRGMTHLFLSMYRGQTIRRLHWVLIHIFFIG